ncbi:MAG: c-type cytochrome biogenesis protein CcmI [Rhodocyclaceae bacterium]|uniref:c-type cytochrome biogenesis protein CcmI n=1 Tax=Cognatazoarcus halotolerans TaxID=2686016 RepID=UPI001357145B|nr:c-type cytochrome biogenesis protein CcmI [Cognatazoarcus halotolerans]MBX3687585.1 c-type cytochrome biogenesis protein CcmI [Rhodocyclaceae bacterium]MCB1910462.1 c-type cytochrome biogenesis protein CcmI [Rhodocyclaceae bacterium]MCP5239166.1 c-type cytochrome biogenesis protein CcmI [Zoogloeaceae bacterium]MCW5615814.1 c-type cytochrome biogenesis protein CcmI [Rhodocyclaceae bacterium]
MTAFFLTAGALLVGALLIVLPPLFGFGIKKSSSPDADIQAQTALAALREQLAALDAERQEGKIDAAEYQQTRNELEARALAEGETVTTGAVAKPAKALGVVLGLLMTTGAALLYLMLGNPAGMDPAQVAGNDSHQITPQQVEQMVETLAKKLESEPDNLEGWVMLGRSYRFLGRFDEAAAVYERLAARTPEDAQIYADWADALGAAQGQTLIGKPEQLIEKALALDPTNIKALALGGTAHFEKKEFAKAAQTWERILPLIPPGEEFARQITGGINEARANAGMAPLAQGGPAVTAMAPGPGLTLSGEISLAPELAAKASPDDAVFIFARSAAGGPPLAAIRKTVADLPLKFDFTGVPLMAGGAVPATVSLGARVAKGGGPMASPGDLEGGIASVASDASGISVVIDTVRP